MNRKRVVLAGGSGFLGRALAAELLRRSYEVVVLTRTPRGRNDGVREVEWDGERIGEWIRFLDGAEAVVNLAGRNVNCRHTPENLNALAASRVNSVRAAAGGIYHITRPPRVWVQAGAVGFYGDQRDKVCDENSPAGNDGLASVCVQWEGAFHSAPAPKTRRVLLRIGMVLGRNGGALAVLGKLTRWFLGGAAGNGQQYVGWIHLTDLNRMFLEAIERDDLAGTFNATAPNPVNNAEFMRELRRALHRPWSPPAPVWAVRLGSWLMQTDPSLALTSCRCVPKRFLESGFQFQFPGLRAALQDIYG
jgi:hypothetical protein